MPSSGGGKSESGEAPIGKPAVAGCGYMELEVEAFVSEALDLLFLTLPQGDDRGGSIVCLSFLPTVSQASSSIPSNP
jgi:hypothetical protein